MIDFINKETLIFKFIRNLVSVEAVEVLVSINVYLNHYLFRN